MCDICRFPGPLTSGTPAPFERPAGHAVDRVPPTLELGFLELEIGPPAGTIDMAAESALFAANSAKMALVLGVAFEQSLDPRG